MALLSQRLPATVILPFVRTRVTDLLAIRDETSTRLLLLLAALCVLVVVLVVVAGLSRLIPEGSFMQSVAGSPGYFAPEVCALADFVCCCEGRSQGLLRCVLCSFLFFLPCMELLPYRLCWTAHAGTRRKSTFGGWLIDWLVGWLVGCFACRLGGWFVGASKAGPCASLDFCCPSCHACACG